MARFSLSERSQAFVREIGGIVLGVLIALSLGAVATAVGWRMDAADARRALSLELGEIIGQGRERELANACIEARLDKVAAAIDAAELTGRLPPLGEIGDPPWRTWSHGVWDSTISSDIASHMDRETLDNLSGAYEFVTILNRESAFEFESWTRLYGMVGPGRATTPAEVVDLRAALTRSRASHRLMVLSAVRLRQIADAYDLPYDRGTVAQWANDSLARRYCAPIPPPNGKGYGQAPFSGSYRRVLQNPILRDSTGR